MLERVLEILSERVGLLLQEPEADVALGVETQQQVGHLRDDQLPFGALHEDELQPVLLERVATVFLVRRPHVAGNGGCHAGVFVVVAGIGEQRAFVIQQSANEKTVYFTARRATERRDGHSQRVFDAASVGLAQHLRQRLRFQHLTRQCRIMANVTLTLVSRGNTERPLHII